MSNLLLLPLTLLAGFALSLFYFGGLWLTVRRLPTAQNPVLLTLVSFLGRLAIVLASFALITASAQNSSPLPLLASLAIFFWTRNRLIQRLQHHPLARR
ncbi:MAG: ATP synthase subunit I [Nostocaceae cyanobacterium]|nr:ATP synthase subunit I [Nostocaceae cyanobacterium]